MTIVAERIFKDALALLPVERAELIEKLFQSFDAFSQPRPKKLAHENQQVLNNSALYQLI